MEVGYLAYYPEALDHALGGEVIHTLDKAREIALCRNRGPRTIITRSPASLEKPILDV